MSGEWDDGWPAGADSDLAKENELLRRHARAQFESRSLSGAVVVSGHDDWVPMLGRAVRVTQLDAEGRPVQTQVLPVVGRSGYEVVVWVGEVDEDNVGGRCDKPVTHESGGSLGGCALPSGHDGECL